MFNFIFFYRVDEVYRHIIVDLVVYYFFIFSFMQFPYDTSSTILRFFIVPNSFNSRSNFLIIIKDFQNMYKNYLISDTCPTNKESYV